MEMVLLFVLLGLFSYSEGVCNSQGYHKCLGPFSNSIDPTSDDFCSTRENKFNEFRNCVNNEVKDCTEAISKPQIESMRQEINGYINSFDCADINTDDEDDAWDDDDDWGDDWDENEESDTGSSATLAPRLCDANAPSRCASNLHNILNPDNVEQFCKVVDDVLAVYKACVAAGISGCHENIAKQHRASMEAQVASYQTHIESCQDGGPCYNSGEREENMDECITDLDSADPADICRLIKEEVACAWTIAEGCVDTEDYFREQYDDVIEDYNVNNNCGITVGGTTPAPPAPTESAKPAIRNCLAIRERSCFPQRVDNVKETTEAAFLLMEQLDALHEGSTQDYDKLCKSFKILSNFPQKVNCTYNAARSCFGDTFLNGFNPEYFAQNVKTHCLEMLAGPVRECFH